MIKVIKNLIVTGLILALGYSQSALSKPSSSNVGTYPNGLLVFNPTERTKITGSCFPTDSSHSYGGENFNKQPSNITCTFQLVTVTKDDRSHNFTDKDIEAMVKSLREDKRLKGKSGDQIDEQVRKIFLESLKKSSMKGEDDRKFLKFINRKRIPLKELITAILSHETKRKQESCNLFISGWELSYKLDRNTNNYIAEDASGFSNCGHKMISILWKDPDLSNVWNITQKDIYTDINGSYGLGKTSCKKIVDKTTYYYGGTYHKDKKVSNNYNPNIYVNCKWIDLSQVL